MIEKTNCITHSTRVMTEHGEIPIEVLYRNSRDPKRPKIRITVQEGDGYAYESPIAIKIWDGQKVVKVPAYIMKGNETNLLKIKTHTTELEVCPEQMILTENGWQPASKIKPTNRVWIIKHDTITLDEVIEVEKTEKKPVYHLYTPTGGGFVLNHIVTS